MSILTYDASTTVYEVGFQVLTAASIKMTGFWDITSCSLVEVDVYFWVHTVSIVRVIANENTWRYIPEGCLVIFTVSKAHLQL
jgi:hypothetical protein